MFNWLVNGQRCAAVVGAPFARTLSALCYNTAMKRLRLVLGVAAVSVAVVCQQSRAAEAALPTWEGEGLAAWTVGGNLVNKRLEGGVMAGETKVPDSQLYAQVERPFAPEVNHEVLIRMRLPAGGNGDFFWQGEGDKEMHRNRRADLTFAGDGKWHEYRVRPFWQGGGRIVRVRIDVPHTLPAGSRVELGSVRIVRDEDVLRNMADVPEGASGVTFALATPQMEHVTLEWVDGAVPGLSRRGFTTPPDGLEHRYWFDLRRPGDGRYAKQLKGRPVYVGVRQYLKGRDLPVKDLRWVVGAPDLPADLGITSALPEEAIPRAGRPFPIEVIVRNYGTRPATGLRFAVEGLPEGVRPAKPEELSPTGTVAACAGWDSVGGDMKPGLPNERRFRVTLTDPGVADFTAKLRLIADGGIVRAADVRVRTQPSLGLARRDYPAEPRPVATAPYRVGAFLFPGWDTHLWHGVWSRAAERKPLLGWYDETNPEVVDWQIKHLAENGVSFVYVDWYWNRGREWHNHWTRVFPKTRYRRFLKWAVMWANHNRGGSHSFADQEKVTRFWIDNFFRQDEYLTENGMPVVVIWSAEEMENDLRGKGGCKALLDLSRRVAREAGFKGVWFVAVRQVDGRADRAWLKTYEDRGFDATCIYKYIGNGRDDLPRVNGVRRFDWIADTSADHWRAVRANSRLPFLPSLSTSYDARPWRLDYGSVVEGYDVAKFRRICRDAKAFADETGVRTLMVGPLDEWGEGSIGYPNAQFGFGILEAVRDTFGVKPAEGWPVNHAPEDVGLGPYPAPGTAL